MIKLDSAEDDCTDCEGGFCDVLTVTVITEGAVSDLSPVSDCKYGDTVKLDRADGSNMAVFEIGIVGKPGKFPFIKIYILHIQHNSVCTLYIT